jgi:YhcH/YjgK/YiaL family protein
MITDDIKNLKQYNIVSEKVLEFLNNLTPDTQAGHYEIDETAYANIDIYNTKPVENCKFEAHKKYIDIQMLLEGFEELDYTNVKDLIVSEEYNSARDVMFFKNPTKSADTLQLEPFKFAFIYPYEAHRPQMGNNTKVKKVVVKIAV